jgi:hypothetical protein
LITYANGQLSHRYLQSSDSGSGSHARAVSSGYAQELQAEMNQELLEMMHQTELDDWSRFGKIRQAEEKRLRDPDDVLIHAKERRQELRKKRKK